MGLTQSAPKSTRKYSDYEIKQNINKLFRVNRTNFSEASCSLNFDNIRTVEHNPSYNEQNVQMGGKIKFNPSQKRYLKYNINEYIKRIQEGGNPNNEEYVSMSEPSEFNKLRDFLTSGNQQLGGSHSLYSTEASADFNNNNNFFKTLFQISQEGGDDDSEANEEMSTDEIEADEEIGKAKNENDSDDDDNDDDDDDDDEEDDDEEEDDDDDDDEDEADDNTESDDANLNKKKDNTMSSENSLSATSSINVGPAKSWSPTSYSQSTTNKSSDLNIVPFYSTDSSAQHPYVRNRFN